MEDTTWKWRLVIGLSLLLVLAIVDFVRHPDNPTRIKEYGFTLGSALAAMAFGLLHDAVTYTISAEYFFVGKGLGGARSGFFPEVAVLALKASWSVGLIVGLAFVVANNPSKRWKQLAYRSLARFSLFPFVGAVIAAALFGSIAWARSRELVVWAGFDGLSLEAPERFLAVWAIHTGTYLGAMIGTIAGVVAILRMRRLFPLRVAGER